MSAYKILIVEDHDISKKLLMKQLEGQGYSDIDEAPNGREALAKLQHRHYDIVLFDWYMPLMSGMEFMKQVKELNMTDNTAFVLVSAEADQDNLLHILELGAISYITKPIFQEELTLKMDKVISWLNTHS